MMQIMNSGASSLSSLLSAKQFTLCDNLILQPVLKYVDTMAEPWLKVSKFKYLCPTLSLVIATCSCWLAYGMTSCRDCPQTGLYLFNAQ